MRFVQKAIDFLCYPLRHSSTHCSGVLLVLQVHSNVVHGTAFVVCIDKRRFSGSGFACKFNWRVLNIKPKNICRFVIGNGRTKKQAIIGFHHAFNRAPVRVHHPAIIGLYPRFKVSKNISAAKAINCLFRIANHQ